MSIIFQTPCLKLAQVLRIGGRLWFAAERTSKGKLLAGALLLVLLVTNIIATTSSIKYFGVEAGKRHQTDGTVLGRGKRSEQVGALGLLLELLRQYIEPLTDILWRELLGLPRQRLLTLLAHRGSVSLAVDTSRGVNPNPNPTE